MAKLMWNRKLLRKPLILMTLMLCLSVFCFPPAGWTGSITGWPELTAGWTGLAMASDSGEETLYVEAAWVDGGLLRINVVDAQGESSAFTLNLSDYVDKAENKEFIIIQAVDTEGNKSGLSQIKNPNYVAETETEPAESKPGEQEATEPMPAVIPPMPTGSNPLTPDGSGTVMDYANETEGKEFFTISTEDGSEFFLIVDRQRNTDQVITSKSTEKKMTSTRMKTRKKSKKQMTTKTMET